MIDFGRFVEMDWICLLFWVDYLYDSYWEEVILVFLDGEE